MVSVDEELKDKKVLLRKSMNKFEGVGNGLDIARYFNYPMKLYLNRCAICVRSWFSG
jgi:hypothetical protein